MFKHNKMLFLGGSNMMNKIPSAYVLLFCIIIIIGVATYIIPSGTYDREIDETNGIEYVVPDSYERVERTPVSVFDLFKSIPQGMMEASHIIIFVLIAGGSFGIIQATGIVNNLLGGIAKKYSNREKVIIPIVMILFSLSGAVFGTAEEALPLYPIIIGLSLALGLDNITGVAMVLLGTGAGFVSGFLNPFTTGVAQGLSDLPLFSGILYRILIYIVILGTGIIYVLRYSQKIKNKNIERKYLDDINIDEFSKFTSADKRVVGVIIISFIFLVMGIFKYKFYILEISTTFMIMGILSGLVAGLRPGRISSEFVKGASNLTYGALIIGIANAISVIMNYGNIMDTIIYTLSRAIEGLSPIISATGMFISQSIINVFITSGSGQAAATMPIMSVIADMADMTRQTAVLAFQFGDGFLNMLSPTSGYFIAALAIGDVEWKDWAKWFLPLLIIWVIQSWIFLVIASIINYGPY